MSADLLRNMRAHSGYDPKRVLQHPKQYNRAERRMAAKVLREGGRKEAAS